MDERYGAFLTRCWHRCDGSWRVVVEHIQSGERARLASLAAAVAWMQARVAGESAGDDGLEGEAWQNGVQEVASMEKPTRG
jgi:hypothetical protein